MHIPEISAAVQILFVEKVQLNEAEDQAGTDGTSDQEKKKAKDRRREQQEAAREETFGERGAEPASENYVKWKAREKEKRDGKDGRRESHDEKDKGDPDRTKDRVDDDYR